jgi:hypothetical protein
VRGHEPWYLLTNEPAPLRDLLLGRFCPRTGKRSRDSPTPLYCVRTALTYLGLCTASPSLALSRLRQNSSHVARQPWRVAIARVLSNSGRYTEITRMLMPTATSPIRAISANADRRLEASARSRS